MRELLDTIKSTIESFEKDAEARVEKNNKAAGRRARKASLDLEKLFKQFRKQSIEGENAAE